MKTTLTVCFFALCLTTAGSARAQPTVFAGPQLTWAEYSIAGEKQKVENKTGFAAGVSLKSLIEGPVYFAPQLSFTQKGYKVAFDRPAYPPDSGAKNNNVTVRALELAPLIQIDLSKGPSHGFFRFGPAFDVALNGKETFDSLNNKRISRNMLFDFAAYSFVTISGNLQLGYQHRNGLVVFAYYHHGLSSLNNADNGPSIYHRIAGVSVGWRLGRKR